ncbi:MAG: ArsR family transcriptional regulator [Burkholderiales bacterium]|nr:ArsR family transcriptional regulator [Burkholderiales bacterium]
MSAARVAPRRRSAKALALSSAQVVAGLGALAQETRLAAYRQLVQAGPEGLAAGALATALGVAPATLSFHLSALAVAGLVQSRPQGRFVIYAANYAAMNALVSFLTDNCCGGNPCGPGQSPAAACAPLENER